MKYVYPAIFTKEDSGYSIRFPDIESCYTSAETLDEGLDMANDVLCMMLYDMEERKADIPQPSDIASLVCAPNEFATLVSCDTLEYRKFYDNRAVKKTLSIPAWLNTMAEREGINFSATLQNALKEALHME
jgi:predicted RNase H-like HicB family nuclease